MWRLWCRRQTSCSPTGRCTNMNWKKLCWISSRAISTFWCPRPSLRRDWTFRMRTRSSSTTPTGWGCRSSTRSAVASDVPGGLRMRFSCTGATSCCVRRRKNVCRRSVNLRSWEAVSRLRCAIWSCAAPEIFWARNSTVTCRRSVMTCTASS